MSYSHFYYRVSTAFSRNLKGCYWLYIFKSTLLDSFKMIHHSFYNLKVYKFPKLLKSMVVYLQNTHDIILFLQEN